MQIKLINSSESIIQGAAERMNGFKMAITRPTKEWHKPDRYHSIRRFIAFFLLLDWHRYLYHDSHSVRLYVNSLNSNFDTDFANFSIYVSFLFSLSLGKNPSDGKKKDEDDQRQGSKRRIRKKTSMSRSRRSTDEGERERQGRKEVEEKFKGGRGSDWSG